MGSEEEEGRSEGVTLWHCQNQFGLSRSGGSFTSFSRFLLADIIVSLKCAWLVIFYYCVAPSTYVVDWGKG